VITDAQNEIIGSATPEKWYSSKLAFEYRGQAFQLEVRNNPLAEWVLKSEGRDVLAYGLDTTDKKPRIRIISGLKKEDLLLDAIMWYLFAPIAAQQMG